MVGVKVFGCSEGSRGWIGGINGGAYAVGRCSEKLGKFDGNWARFRGNDWPLSGVEFSLCTILGCSTSVPGLLASLYVSRTGSYCDMAEK